MSDPLFDPPFVSYEHRDGTWVEIPLTQQREYGAHGARMDQLSAVQVLEELERVIGKGPGRVPARYRLEDRVENPLPSPTLYYHLDAVMVPRYFRRFLDEVKAWTSKQATRADRTLGKRAQRVVLTLMTLAKSDDRGPRPIHKEVLEDRRAYVLKHRPPLLREAQQIVRAYRPPQGTPLEYRDRLVRLYHK